MWLVWLALGAVCIVVEVNTGTFYILMLGVSALLTMFVSLFDIALVWQGIIFIVVTFLLYVYLIPIVRKLLPPQRETVPTTSEMMIGQHGFVSKDVVPGEGGQVKVDGEVWSALANEVILKGEKIIVTGVNVSKLHIKKDR